MTYLTDRKQIVQSVLFGLGEVVDSPIYFFRPEYDKDLKSYPFDPQKGLALLHEAGWQDTDGDGVLDKVIDGKKDSAAFRDQGQLGQRRAQERGSGAGGGASASTASTRACASSTGRFF